MRRWPASRYHRFRLEAGVAAWTRRLACIRAQSRALPELAASLLLQSPLRCIAAATHLHPEASRRSSAYVAQSSAGGSVASSLSESTLGQIERPVKRFGRTADRLSNTHYHLQARRDTLPSPGHQTATVSAHPECRTTLAADKHNPDADPDSGLQAKRQPQEPQISGADHERRF